MGTWFREIGVTLFGMFEDSHSEAEAARQRQRDEEREELHRLMAQPWGRRFVWRQLSRAGVFRLSYTGDAHGTAFNEGARNLGLQLLADLHEYCADKYATMLDENRMNDD